MKMIGEILTAEQIADLAVLVPKAGNAILELTTEQLDFLRGYVMGCKAARKEVGNEKDLMPKWISAANPPVHWRESDEDKTLVNYLVVSPDHGVDIGSYAKLSNTWVILGMPAKVTHWMPLPEPPDDE